MDLPKNVTQIGELNSRYKLYVEDYVISYLKQINRISVDSSKIVALYGVRKQEEDIVFIFIYGAAVIDGCTLEDDRVSPMDREKMKQVGMQHFEELELVGFKALDGEPIESFNIFEVAKIYLIFGYVQFYEKNEAMLNYMVNNSNKENSKPETNNTLVDTRPNTEYPANQEIDFNKYIKNKETKNKKGGGLLKLVLIAAILALFVNINNQISPSNNKALEALGRNIKIDSANEIKKDVTQLTKESLNYLRERLYELKKNIFEGISDNEVAQEDNLNENEIEQMARDKLIIDEDLVEVITNENSTAVVNQEALSGEEVGDQAINNVSSNDAASGVEATDNKVEDNKVETDTETISKAEEQGETLKQPDDQEQANSEKPASNENVQETYIVKKGESLSSICVKKYGSLDKLQEICKLNEITDSDNILEGQKILLP